MLAKIISIIAFAVMKYKPDVWVKKLRKNELIVVMAANKIINFIAE
jgi:hypothetical protein